MKKPTTWRPFHFSDQSISPHLRPCHLLRPAHSPSVCSCHLVFVFLPFQNRIACPTAVTTFTWVLAKSSWLWIGFRFWLLSASVLASRRWYWGCGCEWYSAVPLEQPECRQMVCILGNIAACLALILRDQTCVKCIGHCNSATHFEKWCWALCSCLSYILHLNVKNFACRTDRNLVPNIVCWWDVLRNIMIIIRLSNALWLLSIAGIVSIPVNHKQLTSS